MLRAGLHLGSGSSLLLGLKGRCLVLRRMRCGCGGTLVM